MELDLPCHHYILHGLKKSDWISFAANFAMSYLSRDEYDIDQIGEELSDIFEKLGVQDDAYNKGIFFLYEDFAESLWKLISLGYPVSCVKYYEGFDSNRTACCSCPFST